MAATKHSLLRRLMTSYSDYDKWVPAMLYTLNTLVSNQKDHQP